MHWNGSAWQPSATGPGGVSIHGRSKSDVWSVGYSGVIRHFDGATWTRSAWLGVGLSTIARAPSGAMFVAGHNGAVLRRAK